MNHLQTEKKEFHQPQLLEDNTIEFGIEKAHII